MHGRDLLPFERQLAAGIGGDIRNRITIYRSGRGPSQEYFSRVEYVRDSFGRTAYGEGSTRTDDPPIITVHPGELVTFDMHAWAPDNAPYTWRIIFDGPPTAVTIDDDTFQWHVGEEHIREEQGVTFYLLSDRRYQRRTTYDDAVTLHFRVLPPL
jgi:hypothetical protein